ncbi:MAG: D-alanyl-D-alanine carboxypeptidase family protein [Pseudomonadota bacterium]
MRLRAPTLLAFWFAVAAAGFGGVSGYLVHFDAATAERRFDNLKERDALRRAARNGARALRLSQEAGAPAGEIARLQEKLAVLNEELKQPDRAAGYYGEVLDYEVASGADPERVLELREALARTALAGGDIEAAVEIYADFLMRAGDAGARMESLDSETEEGRFVDALLAVADGFAEAIKPDATDVGLPTDRLVRLAVAQDMADLGAFYAMDADSPHAAAGLLSVAYHVRADLLGVEDPATIQTMMRLGPVYAALGRLDGAEKLYLQVLKAKESERGSNNPDLSLYLRLLAGVYERQGRATEAEALYAHIRRLFSDAYGEQRYARSRIPQSRGDEAVTRPVNAKLPLPEQYRPADLVRASKFGVAVSKPAGIAEMAVRKAQDAGSLSDADTLPARLAQLMSLCEDETGEQLSLRSGYRSYEIQSVLYNRNRSRGTVTPPGQSEHQSGLAVDIDVSRRLMRQSDAAYQCFEENAFRFGFILSYPPENVYLADAEEPFEPWHWRYVGLDTARLYREAGPVGQPQEFLAALPCYAEQASIGAVAARDICLPDAPATDYAAVIPESARILNEAQKASLRRR